SAAAGRTTSDAKSCTHFWSWIWSSSRSSEKSDKVASAGATAARHAKKLLTGNYCSPPARLGKLTGQVFPAPCRSGLVPRAGGTLIRTSTRRALGAGLAFLALGATSFVTAIAAFADGGGNGVPEFRHIVFPVQEHVDYTSTFGDCRDGCTRRHQGNDLIGQ